MSQEPSTMRLVPSFVVVACAALAIGCSYPPYAAARSPGAFPDSPPDVAHAWRFFDGARGAKLFEQEWRPKNEAPKAVFVVVHGLKDHGSRYAELAERLAHDGIAVRAFDLRGHGHSSGVRVWIDSFDDYLDDLDLEMKRADASDPSVPRFLFGHSMGGAIVTRFTIEKKPSLAGLVLSGAALEANVPGPKIVGTKIIAALQPDAGVFQLDLHDFSRDPKVVEACANDPLVYQDPGPARTARELLATFDELEAREPELTVPLLAMHGEADKVTPPEGSKHLVERAGSKDKTLKIYPGLVHDLLHEPERRSVLADVEAWVLARTPGASRPPKAAPAAPEK